MNNLQNNFGSKLTQMASECKKDAKDFLLAKMQKIDDLHLKNRNSKIWRNKGVRKRRILVPGIGIINYKRRLYRNMKTGDYCFWLDKKLEINKKFLVSKEDQKIVLKFYPKLRSYQNVADVVFWWFNHKKHSW